MIRLKELRLEKGMNMRQTAIALNIPYTTYISYEKAEREPNLETLIMLADYFNCSIDYLIGRTRVWRAKVHRVKGKAKAATV